MKNKLLMNAPIEAHTCILSGAKYTKVRLYPVEEPPLCLYTVQAHVPICGVIGYIVDNVAGVWEKLELLKTLGQKIKQI